MNTLTEIEAAVVLLSRLQQEELYQHLAHHLEQGPSCYDLAKDIMEELHRHKGSGIHDLSTNKAHLAGFGESNRSQRT